MRKAIAVTATLATVLACNDGDGPTSVNDATAVVSGFAYVDIDDDATFGATDTPLAGAHAALLAHATGDTVAQTQTAANGRFVFRSLEAGSYRVELDLGSLADSLAVMSSGTTPIVLAQGDSMTAEVRIGYSADPATVAEARTLEAGTRVIISGVALSSAAAFGDSTLHVQDPTAAIRVLRVRDAVAAGDSIRLIGTVGANSGQPVLSAISVSIEPAGSGLPAPDSLATADAASAAAGSRDAAHVVISGTITDIETATDAFLLTIDDGTGALIAELRHAAGFASASSYDTGQLVRVRGVLVPAADGTRWHVLPRNAADVMITAGQVRCTNGRAGQFACHDIDLVAYVPIAGLGGSETAGLNDIWGWTDSQTGREYAIVGRTDGTAFVDISNPVAPVLVANLPKTAEAFSSTWRDMKVYRDHVYVVADGAGPHGVQVVDLTRLREFDGTPLQLTTDALYREVNSVHNIVINEESGFAFAVGSGAGGQTCGSGLHMIDIREPRSPEFAGCFADPLTGRSGTGYTHDAQCVIYSGPDKRYTGREVCFGANETALSIADVTDKSNPVALSRASYPNVAYSHQGWLTDDQRYLYMNDELDETSGLVARTRTMIWDVEDLEDPVLIGEHLGVEASTDHNLYIRGNRMYQANYTSGLRILDITNRAAPVEVAFFDTSPFGENWPGFAGSWSNYPFFDSGLVIVSSMGEGLFVLRPR